MVLQVNLSEEMLERVREAAAQRRESVEAFIAALVEAYFQGAMDVPGSPDDETASWLGLVGLGSSGHADTSSRMREVMDELTAPDYTWSLKEPHEGAR